MVITGSTSRDGSRTELYRDTSNDCAGKYTDPAPPVCQDVIPIPITSYMPWRYVTISTKHYLTLCEVEVFGGKLSNCCLTYFCVAIIVLFLLLEINIFLNRQVLNAARTIATYKVCEA